MPPPSEAERELETLAGDLRRLESEYTKFFAGRAPRPPLEARAQLDREFRKWANRATDGGDRALSAADAAVALFELRGALGSSDARA